MVDIIFAVYYDGHYVEYYVGRINMVDQLKQTTLFISTINYYEP